MLSAAPAESPAAPVLPQAAVHALAVMLLDIAERNEPETAKPAPEAEVART